MSVALALLVAAAAVIVPAGLGWDFANFYDTGARAAHGQLRDIYDPTSPIAGRAPQGNMAFWGVPLSAWFYVPFSLFPAPVALVLFKLAGTAAFAAGLILLYRVLRPEVERHGVRASWYAAMFAVVVLLYQPFWTIYRVGGQTTPFVFLLLVVGLRAYLRERYIVVALSMVLVVLMKPAFGFVPAVLCLLSGRRYLVSLGLVAGATAVLSLALFGWPLHKEFLDVVARGSAKPSPWPFNSSLYIIADAFRPIANSIPVAGKGGWLPDALRLTLKFLVLATVVGLLLASRKRDLAPSRRRLFYYLMAISFCLLISQVVWEHYLGVLFIPLAFLLAGAPRMDRGARIHLGIIFGLTLLQNLVLIKFFRDHVPLTRMMTLLVVSLVKAGPLLVYLSFLWFRREQIFRLLESDDEPRLAVADDLKVAAGAT